MCESVDIKCKFETNSYDAVGSINRCVLQNALNIRSRESAVITSQSGIHEGSNTNADVTGFKSEVSSYVIEYLPQNLEKFFTNIKWIYINAGPLKEIKQSDLRPFTKLEYIDLDNNNIEFLEDGLFAYNPELAYVRINNNKIIHIGVQVFDNLNKLTYLLLYGNACVNTNAQKNQTAMRELISQVKIKCYNNGYLTLNNDLKMLEINLACVNNDGFPIFQQNLKSLQNQFKNSAFSQSWSIKERFEALKNVKIDTMANSMLEMLEKMNNIQNGLNNRNSIIEGSNINSNMQTASTVVKIVLISSFVVLFIINIVLLIIYNKIKTE